MTEDMKQLIFDIVDLLMPELTPYESSLYLLLFRRSILQNGSPQVRIGKRTVAEKLGTSSRAATKISFYQITEVLKSLEKKGCIGVGDTTREGTLYTIIRPHEIESPRVYRRLYNLRG